MFIEYILLKIPNGTNFNIINIYTYISLFPIMTIIKIIKKKKTHHTRAGRRGGRGSRGRHRQYWMILSTTAKPHAPRPAVDIKRTNSLAWDAATSRGGRRGRLLDSETKNFRIENARKNYQDCIYIYTYMVNLICLFLFCLTAWKYRWFIEQNFI